jgi:4-hydroxy-tetrahydrodipicolinate reductase
MKQLRFAILGYGRMGRITKEVLDENNEYISDIIDPNYEGYDWNENSLENADTAICFTSPIVGYETTKRILQKGVDAVVSTTKFYTNHEGSENIEMMKEFENLAQENNCRMIYGANFTIGMNAFFDILKPLAEKMAELEYDIGIDERHHKGKEDIAATAKEIGRIVMEAYPNKNKLNFGDVDRRREENEITITSTRLGNIPGTHIVIFDSPLDTIEFVHSVRDPKLFAQSAIVAAHWVHDQPPGLYRVKDMYG